MKVRLTVSRAGVGLVQTAGEIIDVPADEGRRMIDAGQAELVRRSDPEKAVRKPRSEKAAK